MAIQILFGVRTDILRRILIVLSLFLMSWTRVWFLRRRIERSLRLMLVEQRVPVCLDCGYDLRGQLQPRCPECGQGFEDRFPKGPDSTLGSSS